MRREINYQALAEFRHEIRRFLNFSEHAAKAVGIEPQQHQALLAIRGLAHDGAVTVGWLADQLHIRHHSAVELTNRLEAHGLIRRARGQEDKREVLLRLTKKGGTVLERLSAHHKAELLTAGPRLLKALRFVIERAERPAALKNPPGTSHIQAKES